MSSYAATMILILLWGIWSIVVGVSRGSLPSGFNLLDFHRGAGVRSRGVVRQTRFAFKSSVTFHGRRPLGIVDLHDRPWVFADRHDTVDDVWTTMLHEWAHIRSGDMEHGTAFQLHEVMLQASVGPWLGVEHRLRRPRVTWVRGATWTA